MYGMNEADDRAEILRQALGTLTVSMEFGERYGVAPAEVEAWLRRLIPFAAQAFGDTDGGPSVSLSAGRLLSVQEIDCLLADL